MDAQIYRAAIFSAIKHVTDRHRSLLVDLGNESASFISLRLHAESTDEIDKAVSDLQSICYKAGDPVLALAIQIHVRQHAASSQLFLVHAKSAVRASLGMYAAAKEFPVRYAALHEKLYPQCMILAEMCSANIKNATGKLERLLTSCIRRPVERLLAECISWSDLQFDSAVFNPSDFESIALPFISKKHLPAARSVCIGHAPLDSLLLLLSGDVLAQWRHYLRRVASSGYAGLDDAAEIDLELSAPPSVKSSVGDLAWNDAPLRGLEFFAESFSTLRSSPRKSEDAQNT